MTTVHTVPPRPWLDQVTPYTAGIHSTDGEGSLASNESPLGASPRIPGAVLDAVQQAHRYPDPLARPLRAALAEMHDVEEAQIVIGNGSDELIYLLALAYVAGGGRVVCAHPAYRIDEISTHVVGGKVLRVPLRHWRHDLAAMTEIDAEIAYVVNPHNPTGTTNTPEEHRAFAERSRARLVVFDEAYIDFVDPSPEPSMVPLVSSGRVAVLRTFSKIHGLAGLRLGYLIAPPEVADTLRKVRPPFSVNTLSQAAGLAALADHEHRDRVREHTVRTRDQLLHELREAGLAPVPSQGNFIFVPTMHEHDLVAHFAGHGVSVRPGTALGVPGAIRLSVPSTAGLKLVRTALLDLPRHLPQGS